MNPKKKFYETAAETLIKNLDKRGMAAYPGAAPCLLMKSA